MLAGEKSMGLSRLQIKAHKLARRQLISGWESFLAGGGQALSQIKEKSPHHNNSPQQGSLGLEGRYSMSGQIRMSGAISMEASLSSI